ncbi:effector-associated domain EAD1-containing protein [Dactylosporangium sp. NPDC049525]|uniref:KGGVGR-motif variant AAA ATPase n=1 Tax=Dactylosporangium sp. NPDC049525 TaxID=3154730 RepID=UPI00341B314A
MIVTFYSYKGGTGRTMALVNIAVLLAKAGRRVLVVDFDLEAPGVWRYFADSYSGLDSRPGLLDLLQDHVVRPRSDPPDWHDYTTRIRVGVESVSIMTTGRQDPDYPARVLAFDWSAFFDLHGGGRYFEELRNDWLTEYDFVLVDSRTGITDIGGVCLIALPDLIVPVFVANRQNVDGVVDVLRRAQAGRQALAYDRPPALVLPLLSRFDSRTELEFVNEWLSIAAQRFGEFYADWLPRHVDPRVALERTKLPYVAYFGFGEKLAVLLQGVTDPDSLGYALDTVAHLIDTRLQDISSIAPTKPPLTTPPAALLGPADDSWIAAVYYQDDFVCMAFALDRHRVLVPIGMGVNTQGFAVRFVKAGLDEPVRIAEARTTRRARDAGATVLVLSDPIPTAVRLPRLSFVEPVALIGHRWWTFGIPRNSGPHGTPAYGTIVATLTFGVVQVDPTSRRGVTDGFQGAPLWSPEHDAVVGMIVSTSNDGDGAAITLHRVDALFPDERLRLLAEPVPRIGLGPHETQTLLMELSNIFSDAHEARILLASIDFPPERMPRFAAYSTPKLFWESILDDLENGLIDDGVRLLVQAALRIYPYNPVLRQLEETFR